MPKPTEQALLNKRTFYVRIVVFLMIGLLITLNAGAWLFFRNIQTYFEHDLSKRLYAIADISAKYIEPNIPFAESDFLQNGTSGERLLLESKLQDIRTQYELQGVYVIDRDYRIVVDPSGTFHRGDMLTYVRQDTVALDQAWQGNTSVSPIHVIAGNRFKTAYAPLTDIYLLETPFLLVLEANATFFDFIRMFRRGLILGGVASLAAIIIISIFLVWTINLFIKTHDSLRRSEKLAALGQMSASVAHEIRNPLGIIKATADVLKSKYSQPETQDELFDYIGAEVHRLNNLVNDFLTFAREPSLNLSSKSLQQTIDKAVQAMKRPGQQIEIRTNYADNLPDYPHDDEKMYQILLNLLMNAMQAIEIEGVVTVTISVDSNHQAIKIEIADTGVGIEGDVSQIFEPFYTTKSTGSGLGLAITKQIAEKHGGWIEVRSIPKQGTTMTLIFPLK
ncbi:hypothetical protein JW960_01690 [candidate division KSB1 bacterium]|nr:hypothetical protein [candidate division KSB1 bacterium]